MNTQTIIYVAAAALILAVAFGVIRHVVRRASATGGTGTGGSHGHDGSDQTDETSVDTRP